MSSAGSFQGLQFRILETLEKQPGQAPLTALEIAEILHQNEYRTEMKDNVVFKVARAVHGMKETGKIVVADARDKDGRLCYQLPMRVKFPPRPEGEKPANPVLTPEIAAKVQTTEPQPEPARSAKPSGPGKTLYVRGVLDKITAVIDKAAHPLTGRDLQDTIGALYREAGVTDEERITQLIAGNLGYLVTKKRTVYRRRVTGYGMGLKYEYYTRRTGTAPHPSALKNAPKETAPLPSKAWVEPAVVEHVREAAPTPGGAFRPHKPELDEVEVKFRWPATFNNRVVAAAKLADLSTTEFVRQALDFAITNLEV